MSLIPGPFVRRQQERDSRMRCISMLPEDTVEACSHWSSTSPRNQAARGSSLGHLGGDVA